MEDSPGWKDHVGAGFGGFQKWDDPDEGHKKFLHSSLKVYRKKRILRDVYLQCGWKPDSAERP
jgi:hypothetical protein